MHDISGTGCTARLTYECAEVERDSVTKRLQEFIKKQVKQEMDDGQQDTDIE